MFTFTNPLLSGFTILKIFQFLRRMLSDDTTDIFSPYCGGNLWEINGKNFLLGSQGFVPRLEIPINNSYFPYDGLENIGLGVTVNVTGDKGNKSHMNSDEVGLRSILGFNHFLNVIQRDIGFPCIRWSRLRGFYHLWDSWIFSLF
ncbi:hypothetical protein ABKN59_003553 [Abortiporus biennis]